MLVALAIGGIGSATVILSLARLPAAEQSSRVMKLQAIVDSPRPELQPTAASATPEALPAADTVRGNTAAPVQTMHNLAVPINRQAQNRTGRAVSRGKHHYRNFARYFGSRFSASW